MEKTLDRRIILHSDVPASVSDVWKAWTTKDGCKTFFAPDCRIDLRVGGAYEMYFMPDKPAGTRGGEGCSILALQEHAMLSFTWNAPPEMPNIRKQFTHVTLYFNAVDQITTRMQLIHNGWGRGEEWDAAFAYFEKAWGAVVLPRLVHRFKNGPVDWTRPNAFRE